MDKLLQSLLGFLFLATILLIILSNCSFTVGCGGPHVSPEFTEHYSGKGCYDNEVF